MVETRPRMSQLTYAGPVKLTKLPPRSAVVAFSAAEVYAIAELIRRRRGGCAVVMGRLSPRTRNAQVALYQDKEVDFLVATDAIGMGLNMDVDHVAFAGISKHDGHRLRRLTAAEVAQIAGRAGRGMRDGTFGTTAACPPLPDELVRAGRSAQLRADRRALLAQQRARFQPPRRAAGEPDRAPPPGRVWSRQRRGGPGDAGGAGARAGDPRGWRSGRGRLRSCGRRARSPISASSPTRRTRGSAPGYSATSRSEGALPTDWLADQIAALARADGDLDTLMQRLAGIRVWSYIAARSDWVQDAPHWQGRAREVEDLLSDALHERLTTRFVDRRAAHLMRRLEAGEGQELLSAVTSARRSGGGGPPGRA